MNNKKYDMNEYGHYHIPMVLYKHQEDEDNNVGPIIYIRKGELKMKNNKGFSLVELIIVIAIMAILVGVLAPNLIVYIEKTNVSNDVQVCDTLRTAVKTALADPTVVTDPAFVDPFGGATSSAVAVDTFIAAGGSKFQSAVIDSTGAPAGTSSLNGWLQTQCKSTPAKTNGIFTVAKHNDEIGVYIDNSDMTGKKRTGITGAPSSTNDTIFAGNRTAMGW